jgi:hypothetical protein
LIGSLVDQSECAIRHSLETVLIFQPARFFLRTFWLSPVCVEFVCLVDPQDASWAESQIVDETACGLQCWLNPNRKSIA